MRAQAERQSNRHAARHLKRRACTPTPSSPHPDRATDPLPRRSPAIEDRSRAARGHFLLDLITQ
jgi:hypothetical protein